MDATEDDKKQNSAAADGESAGPDSNLTGQQEQEEEDEEEEMEEGDSDEGSDDNEEGEEDEEAEDEEEEDDEGDGEEDDEDDDDNDDDDNDEEDEEEDEEDEDEDEGIEDDSQLVPSQGSESDGEDVLTCPICLDKLRQQDIGSPESCDHQFCMECIVEWSRNINTCPVDRQPFNIILARHPREEKVFKRISVEDKQMEEEEMGEEEEEDTTACEVCHQSDREDRLLLCDGCDLAYHCECLTPPLADVPVEEWFCPTCAEINRQVAASEATDEDAEADPFMGLPRRQIARTRVSERVRHRIQVNRLQRRCPPELVSSEDEAVTIPTPSTSGTSQASTRRTPRKTAPRKKTRKRKRRPTKRKTTKTRKTPKKRKTTATGTAKAKSTKGKRRKGKRRKTKRRKRKTTKKRKPAAGFLSRPNLSLTSQAFSIPLSKTIKGRIAQRLGLSKPPPGRSIPLQRRPTDRSLDLRHGDASIASLSIMGDRDELIAFQDIEEETAHVGALPAAKSASTVAASVRPIIRRRPGVKKPIPASRIAAGAPSLSNSFDLLGSIFQGQSLLHMNTSHITINRDGSLQATKPIKTPNMDRPLSPATGPSRIADLGPAKAAKTADENAAEQNDNEEPGQNPSDGSTQNTSTTSASGSTDHGSSRPEGTTASKNVAAASSTAGTSSERGDGGPGATGPPRANDGHTRRIIIKFKDRKSRSSSDSEGKKSESVTAASDKEEGEIDSRSPSPATQEGSVELAKKQGTEKEAVVDDGSDAFQKGAEEEKSEEKAMEGENEEKEEDDDDRGPPAIPFSLGRFLSQLSQRTTPEDFRGPSTSQDYGRSEAQCVKGTYVRVNKDQVDVNDLDHRLGWLSQQRRKETMLMKMYGLAGEEPGKKRKRSGSDDQKDQAGRAGANDRPGRPVPREQNKDRYPPSGPQDAQRSRPIERPKRQREADDDDGSGRDKKAKACGEPPERDRRDQTCQGVSEKDKNQNKDSGLGKRPISSAKRGRESQPRDVTQDRGQQQNADVSGAAYAWAGWSGQGQGAQLQGHSGQFQCRGGQGGGGFDHGGQNGGGGSSGNLGGYPGHASGWQGDWNTQMGQEAVGCESGYGNAQAYYAWTGQGQQGDWNAQRGQESVVGQGIFGNGQGYYAWTGQGQDVSGFSQQQYPEEQQYLDAQAMYSYGYTDSYMAAVIAQANLQGANSYQSWMAGGYQQRAHQPLQQQQPAYQQPPHIPPSQHQLPQQQQQPQPQQQQQPQPSHILPPHQQEAPQFTLPQKQQKQKQPPPLPPPQALQIPLPRQKPQASPITLPQQLPQPLPPPAAPPPVATNLRNTSELDSSKKSSSRSQNSTGVKKQPSAGNASYGGSGAGDTVPVQAYLQGVGQVTGAGDGAGTLPGQDAGEDQQVDGSNGDVGADEEEDVVAYVAKSKSGNDQESRVIEEVKQAIRPFYSSRLITKEEYKEILKKCVPKVIKSGEINPRKISHLVSAYVKKYQSARTK